MAKTKPEAGGIQTKFDYARKEMSKTLIERDAEVDLILTALLCKQHPLLVGPPGTAKSMLLDSVARFMGTGVKKFDYLFTKFTDPMEVFGPVDLVALKNQQCARVIDGMMPEAEFVFMDEVFKASSAILNTFLKILNERTFKYGKQEKKCPLRICVAASNEWPESQEELGALFDRFLFRKTVKPIGTRDGRKRLLALNIQGDGVPNRDHSPNFKTTITGTELDQAFTEVKAIMWSREAADAMFEILSELGKQEVRVSDRRQYNSVMAVQAYSYLNGFQIVKPEHLEVLAHVLWDDPREQPEKCAKIVAKIANPVGMQVNDILMQVEELMDPVKTKPGEAKVALEEVQNKLSKLPEDPRVIKAMTHVADCIKETFDRIIHADRLKKHQPVTM